MVFFCKLSNQRDESAVTNYYAQCSKFIASQWSQVFGAQRFESSLRKKSGKINEKFADAIVKSRPKRGEFQADRIM